MHRYLNDIALIASLLRQRIVVRTTSRCSPSNLCQRRNKLLETCGGLNYMHTHAQTWTLEEHFTRLEEESRQLGEGNDFPPHPPGPDL
jgi:hypothetical protein